MVFVMENIQKSYGGIFCGLDFPQGEFSGERKFPEEIFLGKIITQEDQTSFEKQ